MADPKPTPNRQEIASAGRDITQPVWGGVLRPQDHVLLERGGVFGGLPVYEDIERDPWVFDKLNKRKLAAIARQWTVEPGGSRRIDRQAAKWLEEKLKTWAFDRWWRDLSDATLKGFAVSEVMWGQDADGMIVPATLLSRDQRRFLFDENRQLRLLTWENMMPGEPLPERKFIVHTFGGKAEDPYGKGLGHQLFWPVLFKRQGIAFWLVYCEKFGNPTVKGIYPEDMLEEKQIELLNTLSNLSQESAFVAPAGTDVSLLEASRSGTVNTYEQLCRFMDEQIAVCVVGQTLTSTQGRQGSQALGNVHADVQAELVDADCDLLAQTFQDTLWRWLVEFNFPGAAVPLVSRPRPTREEDEAGAKNARIGARDTARAFVTAMRDDGWEPDDAAASLEDQANGDWTYVGKPAALPVVAPLTPADQVPGPAFAAPALPAPSAPPRDALDDLADQLDGVAEPAMDGMIGKIRDLIDQVEREGGTLQDVADRLVKLYPQLDAGDLARAMGQAMALAHLQGRDAILAGV